MVETSEFGWFIIYMDKLGAPAWKSAAESLIKSDVQTSVIENAEKTYTVTVNEEILATLPA